MANVFLNLPLPAGNGAGAQVDTSSLGRDKTVTIQGSFTDPKTGQGPSISVQVSVDGGITWAGIFNWSAPAKKTFQVAAQFMRTFVQDFDPLIPMAANIDVASDDIGALFATLPVTPVAGIGAIVNVEPLGNFKTVIVDGDFSGSLHVDISEDGIGWLECMTFNRPGALRSKGFTAKFMRVRRTGVNSQVSGIAVCAVGAINDAGSGGGVDEKVKATVADTTTGYLADKLAAGDGIALALINPGADEEIEISVDGADAGEIVTGDPITVRGDTNDEGVGLEIARAAHQHRLELEVEDEGALAGARPAINFVGAGVGAADDPVGDKVDITIPGNVTDGASVVRSTYVATPTSTSGNAWVDGMSGLNVTVPIDGNYWAVWEGEFMNSNASAILQTGIGVNSTVVAVASSERDTQGNASDYGAFITTVDLGPLVAGDLIRGLFRKLSGPQSVSLIRRNLTIFKVQ